MFTPPDAVRPPTISLTVEEIDQIKLEIAAGNLPANYLQLAAHAAARNVFGHDAVKVSGRYVEQGIGAKGRETSNHFLALKKAESMGLELVGTYDKAVAEIWKRDPERAQKLGLPGKR